MEERLLRQETTMTESEYEAAVDRLLAEMQEINRQMENDRIEIDRLTAETRVLKAETRAILLSMGAVL